MLLTLLVTLSAQTPHAALHPEGADLYVESLAVAPLLAAYAQAPTVRLVKSDGAQRIADLTKEVGWDLGAILAGVMPAPDPARPDDPLWPWSAAARASASFHGIDGAPATGGTRPGAWCILDFIDAQSAAQAAAALGAMAAPGAAADGAPAELALGERRIPIVELGDLLGDAWPAAWLANIDARLVVGAGAARPEEYAARAAAAEGGMLPAWTASNPAAQFTQPAGVTVLELLADFDERPAFLGEALPGPLASAAVSTVAPFLSAKGRWRVQLRGDRFVTESLFTPTGGAKALDAALGRSALAARAYELAPPEAVGAWVTTIDPAQAEALAEQLLATLPGDGATALPERKADEPRLADGLGASVAICLMPFQGLVPPTPRALVAAELKDAARFERGLDAWLARIQAAYPSVAIERKPYRKVNLITLSFGDAGAPEDAAPSAGAGGAMDMLGGIEPTRPAIAVLSDRVILASAASVARAEIKRLQDAQQARHPIAAQSGRPASAFEASTMDWAGFLGKLYDAARGFAPMLAQNLGKPVDVEQLPTSKELFAGFRPTASWSVRSGERVRTFSESSFGPETPLGLFLLTRVVSQASERRPGRGAGPATGTPIADAPAEAPPAEDGGAATLSALRDARTALVVYRAQTGKIPATLEELLVGTPDFPDGFLPGRQLPVDGWKRALVYQRAADGAGYTLHSCGPDGIDQHGAGDDVRLP